MTEVPDVGFVPQTPGTSKPLHSRPSESGIPEVHQTSLAGSIPAGRTLLAFAPIFDDRRPVLDNEIAPDWYEDEPSPEDEC